MSLAKIISEKPQQLEALFALSPLAVCAIEMPTMRFIAANNNYCRSLGRPLSQDEVVGRTVLEVLENPSPIALRGLEKAHFDNLPTTFDTEVSTCLGKNRSFVSGALLPFHREGERSVALTILTEVSERGLLTRIFHELRTPLTGLKIATQFSLRNLSVMTQDDIKKQMTLIDEKANELTRLINSWPEKIQWKDSK